MASWHRRFNVSGTVEVDERFEEWCQVLREVLEIDDVPFINYMTGGVTIIAYSIKADVVSSGGDFQYVYALAHGERPLWHHFVDKLKSTLASAEIKCLFHVHDSVEVLP